MRLGRKVSRRELDTLIPLPAHGLQMTSPVQDSSGHPSLWNECTCNVKLLMPFCVCVCLSGWSHKWLSLQPKQILCLTHCLNIAKCARCLVLKSRKSVSLCWEVFWHQGATPKGTFSVQIGSDSPEPGCYTVKRQTLCRTAAVSPSKYLSWNLRNEITSLYLDYDGSDVKFLQIFN